MADTDWADQKARELVHKAIDSDRITALLDPRVTHITFGDFVPELASALRDARREALEEAALVAERNPEPYIPMRIRALAAGGKAE